MREPDHDDPPTWYYHVSQNNQDAHPGMQEDCPICARLKPAPPIHPRPRALSYQEAIQLIEEGWRKCAECGAALKRPTATGYCKKCWPARRKEIEKLTWEDVQ